VANYNFVAGKIEEQFYHYEQKRCVEAVLYF